MSGQGISQIVFYAVALVALGYPLGHLHGARVHRASALGGRGSSAASTGSCAVDGPKEQDWKSYGATVLVFSVLFFGSCSTRSSGSRGISS